MNAITDKSIMINKIIRLKHRVISDYIKRLNLIGLF